MALETASYINGLVATNPTATDTVAQADDHIRLIKAAIKATFPNVTGAITATQAEINKLDGFTGTVTDLNYAKDLRATGVTSTEFDYLDGVTSNIQTQLNAKQATITGAASTGASSNLTTNRAMITNGSGKMSVSAVTSTELGYLDGVTSNIQTQLNNVSGYPLDVRVLTSGSYTIPAGAKAVLIKASGAGGGGSYHIYPTSGGNGGTGGTTTVTNGTLGISITATGGGGGKYSGAGVSSFVGGSSGGDVQLGAGAAGGDSYKANWDISAHGGRSGNQVTKYVISSSVGGQTLSITYGAGGTAGSSASAGANGFVEIWVW
jgi:hypothetical protein